jgi:large subunit ribosomal protein L22
MTMVAKATYRFSGISAQKARLVVDQIRGRGVGEALGILKASTKRVAKDVEKALNSAIANASNREERVDVDRLFVSEAFVNEGPTEKRGRAGSMGRFFRIMHRSSHITVALDVRGR